MPASLFKTIFQGLEDDALQALEAVAEKRHYPAGVTLCRQGAVEHTFYIVVEGEVAVKQRLADGQERLLGRRGPQEFFGELGLIDDMPRMADCVTAQPTTVWEITEEVFDRLVEESPVIAQAITRHTLTLLRETDRLAIDDLRAKNARLQRAYRELQEAQRQLVEKERLLREIEIAAQVQQTLLPQRLPAYPDYRFAAHLRPARQVGGDYYDVIEIDKEHVGLLLADVSDKSIQAALFMAVTYTLFTVAARQSLSPSEVALAVHRGMFEVAPHNDMFVTAFYGILHRPTGRLRYVTAGQERPLLVHPQKEVTPLPGEGRFLGMLDPLELDEYTIQLGPQDRLFLFSDGLPDTINPAGEAYHYDRLYQALERYRALPAADLVQRMTQEVAEWQQEAPHFDDLTLLAVENCQTAGPE